ncbi:MAG: hypothetical protein J5I90_12930 [Caldilineales bacterium]|nr:hypothetical protein [Caldilineales bacterium]
MAEITAPFAQPRVVTDLAECDFYHTMDIPGFGPVTGAWDLRDDPDAYLGNVDFDGKRVLEIGTASGYLCFHMESRGAEVVAYDLNENYDWDVVPFAGQDSDAFQAERKTHIRRLNNGFWLNHRAHNSQAKMVYGTVYDIPSGIGMVDISTLCSMLLHLRDPFLALQNAARLTRETIIVAELMWQHPLVVRLLSRLRSPYMAFLPDFRSGQPNETWWLFSPEVMQQYLGVLGFEKSRIVYHHQIYQGKKQALYTIVATRTKG